MIRVVLDTNVLVAAALSASGPSAELFTLVATKLVRPCISQPVIDEYIDVLSRPELGIGRRTVDKLLKQLLLVCEWVTPTKSVDASPDPDDNAFLECAEEAKAHYLVTANLRHFPARWKYTRIVTVRRLLDLLTSTPQKLPH